MEKFPLHNTPEVHHFDAEQLGQLREELAVYQELDWRKEPLIDKFHDVLREDEHKIAAVFRGEGPLGQFYRSCYPDVPGRELWDIAFTDARCFGQIETLRSFSGFDPQGKCYDIDTRKIKELCFGTPLEDPAVDGMVLTTQRVAENPALVSRIEHGMPKKLQLMVAATTLAALRPRDTENGRDRAADGLKAMIELWRLSDDESQFVLEQVAIMRNNAAMRHKKGDLLNIVLRSEELTQKYAKKEGELNLETLGGREALKEIAVAGFESFSKSFRYNGVSDGLWQDIERAVSSELLEQLFPYEDRKELVLDEYMKPWAWSYAPPANTAEYLTKAEAELLMSLKISERREVPDPGNGNSFNPTVSWVAQLLGASPETVSALRDNEIKADYEVLAECSDDPEVKEYAHERLAAFEIVDKGLLDLLEQYRRACSNNAFHVYLDGHYCGNDPELEREYNEFYQTKNARAEQLRHEIVELQAKIAKKLGTDE